MKPGHISSGRIYFGLSGYAQGLGALTNIVAETLGKKFKSALDPLSFAFGSLGRIFFRMSNDHGESGFKNQPLSYQSFKNELGKFFKSKFGKKE